MQMTPTTQAEPPIRLGIIHLLVWTACGAVLLAIHRLVDSHFSSDTTFRMLRTVISVPYSFVSGASVASLAVLIHRRANGWRYPLTAGHWVLTISGIVAVLYGLQFIGSHVLEVFVDAKMLPESVGNGKIMTLVHTCISACSALLMGTLLLVSMPLRWKAYALLETLALLLQTLGLMLILFAEFLSPGPFWLFELSFYVAIASIVPLGFCLVQDLRDPESYDFLHWTGWGVAFMGVVMSLLWKVAASVI